MHEYLDDVFWYACCIRLFYTSVYNIMFYMYSMPTFIMAYILVVHSRFVKIIVIVRTSLVTLSWWFIWQIILTRFSSKGHPTIWMFNTLPGCELYFTYRYFCWGKHFTNLYLFLEYEKNRRNKNDVYWRGWSGSGHVTLLSSKWLFFVRTHFVTSTVRHSFYV
jgi:hypothetical protein